MEARDCKVGLNIQLVCARLSVSLHCVTESCNMYICKHASLNLVERDEDGAECANLILKVTMCLGAMVRLGTEGDEDVVVFWCACLLPCCSLAF